MKEEENYLYMYPELSGEGKAKTQEIVNKFKTQLEKIVNDTLYEFTCNIGNEIVDDDAWINVRQMTLGALYGYRTEGTYSYVNWEQVRRKIFEENREQIISDILIDKEKEIAGLKRTIELIQELR